MDKEVMAHIQMEYYSAIKNNSLESVLIRWMNLEPIIQSEVRQKDKNQYSILKHKIQKLKGVNIVSSWEKKMGKEEIEDCCVSKLFDS